MEIKIPKQIERIFNDIDKSFEKYYLGSLGTFKRGKGIANKDLTDSGVNCITYGQLYTNFNEQIEKIYTHTTLQTSRNSQAVKLNDLLFAGSGETIDEIGKASVYKVNEFAVAGGDIMIFTPDANVDAEFLSYYLNSDLYKSQVRRFGQGYSVVHIYSNLLEKIIVALPPLDEQKKIAKILSTWDRAIELQDVLIKKYLLYKKAFQQIIYRGEMKFPNYKFQKAKLKNYIAEIKNKNKDDLFKTVLSVTNSRGFVLQSDQFGKAVASKNLRGYKIVSKNQFAYNPSRINVGSISILEEFEDGLLSPMYVVFKAKDNISKNYLFHYFKSSEFVRRIPLYVQGSVRDSLSFEAMKAMPIYLPDIELQENISKLFDKIDEIIKLHENKLVCIKEQKKGLMQQLLTGKIRVQY